jgi:hypothetical protein
MYHGKQWEDRFLFLAELSFWRGFKLRLASPGLDGHGFWRPVIYLHELL